MKEKGHYIAAGVSGLATAVLITLIRFVDVASALVRNFGRATPVPYAKFYKGNLVLVISTNEE